jgi:pimeloyl-ACP methyl ester carboxylesterase
MAWHGPHGRQVYYEDSGRGETVVLMPGWGGSIAELTPLRRALAGEFRVVAVDLPGSGRSQPQPRRYVRSYYQDDAAALAGLLDDLDVTTAHYIGFSDGGEEALLLAALRPAPALSVVTWGAAGQVRSEPGRLDRLARIVDEPAEPFLALAAFLVEAHGVNGARVMVSSWAEALRGIGDISLSLAGLIRCPAMLITGSADPFCPPALVREMAGALPRGQFLESPGAGHDVHLSHQSWLTPVISDWLSSH